MKLIISGNTSKETPFIKEIIDLVMDTVNTLSNASLWALNIRIIEHGEELDYTLGEYTIRCGGDDWRKKTEAINGEKKVIDYAVYTPKTYDNSVTIACTSFSLELESYVQNCCGQRDNSAADTILNQIDENLYRFGCEHTPRSKSDETYNTFPTELVVIGSRFNNVK